MEDNKKRTQIAFDAAPELRHKIKTLALRRNISMTLWILRAIADRIEKETKHDKEIEK